MLGVVHVIDLLNSLCAANRYEPAVSIRQPLVFPETLPLLPALSSL
ncbi:hypothetical protein ACNKHP_22285 [Shigella boydii]